MKYTEGYLAFLDILGFSKFVENENNGEATTNLFEFVKKFSHLFNTSPALNVQVSFFSDTIIITSEKLDKLIVPIYLAESYLKDSLGLLFRGSIVYGKYYHKDGSTFGPAVVEGYKLENRAIYSRIVLSDSIEVDKDDIFFFQDIDGYMCVNPYAMVFNEILTFTPEGSVYPDEIDEGLIEKFKKKRSELLLQIEIHKGSPVVDKYLWRIRAFNTICNCVVNMQPGEVLYANTDHKMSKKLIDEIGKLSIIDRDVFITKYVPNEVNV